MQRPRKRKRSPSPASSAYNPADKPASSADKPARIQFTAASHPDHCVIAFYNITWDNGRLTGRDHKQHEKTLAADLHVALDVYKADVVLLCGCGKIEEGLIEKPWLKLVRSIAGPGFAVKHQSHYTSIVRLNTAHAY